MNRFTMLVDGEIKQVVACRDTGLSTTRLSSLLSGKAVATENEVHALADWASIPPEDVWGALADAVRSHLDSMEIAG